MREDEIQKWEILERRYHEIINKKFDEFIKADNRKLRKKEISSHIIACKEGLFIIREGSKHNSNYIFTNPLCDYEARAYFSLFNGF